MRQYGRARRFLERRLDGVSREAGETESASSQGRRPRQVADGMRLERVMTVTPPLALHPNMGTDGNNGGTCESGSRRKVSPVVVAEQSGTDKAAETGGSLRGTSSLPEGSDDSVEDCGA